MGTGRWSEQNDEESSFVRVEEVLSKRKEAYILVYSRNSPRRHNVSGPGTTTVAASAAASPASAAAREVSTL